jgi:hypothetical protein
MVVRLFGRGESSRTILDTLREAPARPISSPGLMTPTSGHVSAFITRSPGCEEEAGGLGNIDRTSETVAVADRLIRETCCILPKPHEQQIFYSS